MARYRRPPGFEQHVALESNPIDRRLDVKKRFTEEQIIGFLREAKAGLAVAELGSGTASRRPAITSGAASLAA